MLIALLPNATTFVNNVSVETSLSKIGVSCKFPFSPYATLGAYDLLAQLADMKIKVIVQDGSGTHNILNDVLVKDLLEIASSNEGTATTVYDPPYTHVTLMGTIELSEQGAIALNQATKMLISVSGKPTTFELTLHGIDHPINTLEAIKYDQRSVQGGGEVDINVEDYTIMALPRVDLQDIEITYPSKTCTYTPTEILHITHDTNELSVIAGTGRVQAGGVNFHCLDVSNALKVKIRYASNQNVYFLKNIPISKF